MKRVKDVSNVIYHLLDCHEELEKLALNKEGELTFEEVLRIRMVYPELTKIILVLFNLYKREQNSLAHADKALRIKYLNLDPDFRDFTHEMMYSLEKPPS
jgi:hypothetical protein